jgi:hypothetical protein
MPEPPENPAGKRRGHPVVVLFCAWNELLESKMHSMGSRLLGLSDEILRPYAVHFGIQTGSIG